MIGDMNSDIAHINIMMPDLNLLLVFEALLSEHSVTRAALRLGLSQAAVSGALSRLRKVYDDPLFERLQRGLRPTPKAIMLQPLVADALALVRRSLGVAVEDGAADEIVVLGLSDDFEIAYGRALVAAARAAQPNLRLVFRQTNSAMMVKALHDRTIDLALTSGGARDVRIKSQSLGQSGYLCLYDPGRRDSTGPLTLEEYVSRDHILVSFTGLTGVTDDVLAERGLRRRIRTATSHFSGLPFLLAGTDAIATIPSHAAEMIARRHQLALSPPPLPFPAYAIDLSWRFDALRRGHIVTVRNAISDVFRSTRSEEYRVAAGGEGG